MDQRITFVTAEIERRLVEPLDVSHLAALVNLSPSRFSHLFRAETGMSPIRYVRTRRMERAGALLAAAADLGVKEVMARVGCNDPSHFARDFHKYHGMPPREWRAVMNARGQQRTADERTEAADRPAAGAAPQDPPIDR